ncbi:phosphate ABC transporter membrane protein 1 (PhoT family) [Haloarcula quadrata]|uniref:Phosphate transport system permease protein n=4 Tax=Haloarcula TaxID=2237 RepID=Q5V223_HALMA|nr:MULTISPECIES: phosphate ABC transporter permease subunit PstC [Haloarcula]AAV46429.1 phosphate ABC transporter permease protein [Haloarcula marismortui ATCC 43049]EMA16350.1 phosphate ABC transporter permease [Haloarcula sinaiiensis ATCC 33800]NHX41453.1 phosphate ABC transporter permease subunit PstC [Haloarcula sp. R1-2]QCP91156.1 phosphate ABC transporter permease subunit PstC [Haloarcula marismortui ATCC 43049]QUJ72745.1 phosphate ABC transporter permease subunit PstC [Haloarcula sinaii
MSTETPGPDITSRPSGRAARERMYRYVLLLCAAASILVTVSIVVLLARDAVTFFTLVNPVDFFTGTEFLISRNVYGLLPLLSGTLLVTVISAVIALPTGVAAAIYLSEYASDQMRSVLKPGLEILAGIPTVVYGIFALVYVTPFLQTIGLPVNTFNILSASIMVGIMIIPMVSSLSEDAMSAVPDSLRQAGYGMGATKFEVTTGVVVPAAASGIFSSFILALSRAIGETMIVVVAAGSRPRMLNLSDPLANLFQGYQPMTAAMVQINSADSVSQLGFTSLFAIGLTLFVITFLLNLLSNRIAARYREEYE